MLRRWIYRVLLFDTLADDDQVAAIGAHIAADDGRDAADLDPDAGLQHPEAASAAAIDSV